MHMDRTYVDQNQKRPIYVHTDMSSYGGNFVNVFKTLEGLPIWIVIRLCTDDSKIVKYYNDLNSQLEYSVLVLDNFIEEAKEVHMKKNS